MLSRFSRETMRVEVLVALVVGLVHLLLDAGLVERLLGLVGEAFAVGGLVVEDGDVLALVVLGDVVAGDQALLVVAAADAGHVPELALGELRIGRGRRDLQHVAVGIGFRGRDRRRRAIVARRRTGSSRWRSSRRPSAPASDRRHRRSTSSASFLPSTPPAALMSATACSAPFFICRPKADSPPVIGPATATVMSCANAARRQRERRAQCQADELQ